MRFVNMGMARLNPLSAWTFRIGLSVLIHCGLTPCQALVVTEIMYHSGTALEGSADLGEYIELHNETSLPVDLSGSYFNEGIQFSFPSNTVLGPGGFLVLGKSPQRPEGLRIESPWFGPFSGALDNSGERLRLMTKDGVEWFDFAFGTRGDWPASPDGTGHSLVLEPPGSNPKDPRDWKASRVRGGSPGWLDQPSQSDAAPTIGLIDGETSARYFKGFAEPSSGTTSWTQNGFEENADWIPGTAWLGYSSNSQEQAFITTPLNDMRGNYISVYMRIRFSLTQSEIDRLEQLTVTMNYDDGYVLYLNGQRVTANNIGGTPPPFNASANASSDYPPVQHDLTQWVGLLIAGTNTLALQGHNGSLANSSDFIMAPVLEGRLSLPSFHTQPSERLLINEILANSDEGPDWIECYNPTDETIDLGGMGLSDDPKNLFAFTFPNGTVVEPGGFLVISQEDFGFGLSSSGESVYLTSADSQKVVASYAFGEQIARQSVGRFPDGGSDWYRMLTPTPNASNARERSSALLIHEIMYHSPFGQSGDYLEIHNPSGTAVDIGNYRFRGVEFTFPGNTVIPPHGFALIADDPQRAAQIYKLNPSRFLGGFAGALSNSGERISLLDADDLVVDTVRYQDSHPWPVTPDGYGASLERSCISTEFDNPDDWRSSPVSRPSPGEANTHRDCPSSPSRSLILSEIAYHPFTQSTDERDFEFVEVHNLSDQPVALDGWGLVGDVGYLFESGARLEPADTLVIAKNPDRMRNQHPLAAQKILGPYVGDLPNGGGKIILHDPFGYASDWVDYDDDFPWPSLADGFGTREGLGYSLERVCGLLPGYQATTWRASRADEPGPGRFELGISCDESPALASFELAPPIILPDSAPRLTCRITNGDLIKEVFVEYWRDDPEFEDESIQRMAMIESAELDAGLDAASVWEVNLPDFAEHSILRFRILVDIGTGSRILSPSSENDAFSWHSWFVHPVETSSFLPVNHLFISSRNWSQLINWTAPGRVSGSSPNPNWNNEVPAVFVADGVVHDVSVRHQGSRWNRNNGSSIGFDCPSHRPDGIAQVRSWRVRFPSYRNHNGMDVLILQKQAGWPQHVSFEMFKMAGVPAPKTGWVNFKINGCDYNDDSFLIERPGEDMMRDWFQEAGDLFKSQGYTGDEGPWSWGDERLIRGNLNGFREQQRYEYTYDRKTHSWRNNPDDGMEDLVQPLIEGLHRARSGSVQELRSYLIEHFDVERVLRYIATINYVGTFDDMFQNHFLYRKAEDGKWIMLPWDMDNTLGGAFGEWNAHPLRGADESRIGNVGNRSGWWNRIKDSFFIAFEDEYYSVLAYLNSHVYPPNQLRTVIELGANQRGLNQFSVDSLMDHVQRRHQYLNDFITHDKLVPGLDISQVTDEAVLLSWDWKLFGYELQESPTLSGDWDRLEANAVLNGDTYQVILPVEFSNRFFRLYFNTGLR